MLNKSADNFLQKATFTDGVTFHMNASHKQPHLSHLEKGTTTLNLKSYVGFAGSYCAMRHNTWLLLQGLSFSLTRHGQQWPVYTTIDGLSAYWWHWGGSELFFQQDSAPLHFSHEVWNALHVKWDWTNAVVPTKSTSLTSVFVKNLIYADKS